MMSKSMLHFCYFLPGKRFPMKFPKIQIFSEKHLLLPIELALSNKKKEQLLFFRVKSSGEKNYMTTESLLRNRSLLIFVHLPKADIYHLS